MFIDRVIVRVRPEPAARASSRSAARSSSRSGGPDGGDGGPRRGRDRSRRQQPRHAARLHVSRRMEAERGDHGSGSNKTGRSGDDVVLPVPPGTVVRDHDTGDLIGEVLENGDSFVVARGGRGGKGNAWFATSTHQSPREWQPGEEGEAIAARARAQAHRRRRARRAAERRQVHAALRHLAPPRPKIADYPFTTLVAEPRRRAAQRQPHVRRRRHSRHHRGRARREGARTPVPAAHRAHAPAGVPRSRSTRWTGRPEYDQLRREIARYSAELAAKPHCVVFTKMDLLGEDEAPPIEAPDAFGVLRDQRRGAHRARYAEAAWWRELLQMRKAATPARATTSSCPERGACTRGDPGLSVPRSRDCPRSVRARSGCAATLAILDRPTVAIVGTRASDGVRGTRHATAGAHARACRRVRRQRHGARHRRGGPSRCARAAAPRSPCSAPASTCVTRRLTRRSSATSARADSLLSELAPDDAAHRGSFPQRNRIIAALARATIVVEAPVKSGALITAVHALETGSYVAAVPGPIDCRRRRAATSSFATVPPSLDEHGRRPRCCSASTAPIRAARHVRRGTRRAHGCGTHWTAGGAGPRRRSPRARVAAGARDASPRVTRARAARTASRCALTGEIRRM